MFEECTTLAQLNAARNMAVDDGDIVAINNAYNKRRKEIIASHAVYVQLTPMTPSVKEPQLMSCVPIVGRSDELGCIKLTETGFLY